VAGAVKASGRRIVLPLSRRSTSSGRSFRRWCTYLGCPTCDIISTEELSTVFFRLRAVSPLPHGDGGRGGGSRRRQSD
jgi:hypothetical protein